MGRSILWFRQDLRLHDNEALAEAVKNADELIPIYIYDVNAERTGIPRIRFLIESISDLRTQLRALGSDLLIRTGRPEDILYQLAVDTKSQWVYCNRERTRDEIRTQDILEQKLWTIGREIRYNRGKMLYYTSDLPFPVTHCPDSYMAFKKEVEHFIPVRKPLDIPQMIPPLPKGVVAGKLPKLPGKIKSSHQEFQNLFRGGETAGFDALNTSNTHLIPGMLLEQGRLLSPWISMGCLSPKKVYHDSFKMKSEGESTRQNLIYRDYLRLMGKKYGNLIFHKSGIKGIKIEYVSDVKALHRWHNGKTGVPIIDAAMHQLSETGWMPDTLRKLTANYFLNVLKLDWRLGATYFETKLVDYDPCSNWVSWLNLAGLGPDSREDRIIHYDLVGKKLDPDHIYIDTWN